MLGFTLGLPLGIMYLTVKAYQVVTDKYVTKNRIIIVLGIIGVALLAAQVVPPRTWDLYQHYDEINRIREWGTSYAWKRSRYANYYGATALFYVTSLTPWNETLPFIAILTELFIYEKVISYYKNQIGAQSEGIAFFLFLVLSNIVMAISGIRNVLAVVLVNYAIWNFECVSKKNWATNIAIVILAVTIHPASGLLIAIYAVSFVPSHIAGVVISIFILPVLTRFLNNFSESKNAILSSSSGLFSLYTKEQAGLDLRVRIASVILIVFSIVVVLLLVRYEKKADRYLYFICLYSIGTLGMITQGLIYSRMMYGLGVLYPVLMAKYCEDSQDIRVKKVVYCYKWCCLIYCVGMLLFQGYELARAILIK